MQLDKAGGGAAAADEVCRILQTQRLLTEVSIRLLLESLEAHPPLLAGILTSFEAALEDLDQAEGRFRVSGGSRF